MTETPIRPPHVRGHLVVASLLMAGLIGCGPNAAPAPRLPEPAPRPRPTPEPPALGEGPAHSTGTSYEQALAIPEDISAALGEHELTDVELSLPMRSPTFLTDCGVQDSLKVMVQVVVRDGAAVGVTVRTVPDDVKLAECIDRAVRALAWAASKRRDSLTTRY
jgi:hypothetical protein